jgi:hypothetical protein
MDAEAIEAGPFTIMYDSASWPDQEEPALDEFQVHPPTTCRACSSSPTRGVVCWTDIGDHHYDIRVVEPICSEDSHASRRAFSVAFVVAEGQWKRFSERRTLPVPSSVTRELPGVSEDGARRPQT